MPSSDCRERSFGLSGYYTRLLHVAADVVDADVVDVEEVVAQVEFGEM